MALITIYIHCAHAHTTHMYDNVAATYLKHLKLESTDYQIIMNVNDQLIQQATQAIKDGIVRKLNAAKLMIDHDKEIAAGIYTYAVEELGKLEVIKHSPRQGTNYDIDYYDQFNDHEYKFPKAFSYLNKVGHPECIYLSKGKSFSISFSDKSFIKALVAKTQSRLGVFYIDFVYDKPSKTATGLKEIPDIDKDKLVNAISGLEQVIRDYSLLP